jgi:hypothetical protein
MPSRIVTRNLSDKVQLKINFSEALREKLVGAAEQAGRSMTAEIVHRLERSFETATAFDFSMPVRDLLTWRYMGFSAGEEIEDEDLLDIIHDFRDIVLKAPEAERKQFLGKLMAAKLGQKEQPTLEQEMETFVKEQTKGSKRRQAK